jgi:hypothetical protein
MSNYFGTHCHICHICHDVVKDCKCMKAIESQDIKPCNHIFSPIGSGMCKCLRCGISGVIESQDKAEHKRIHDLINKGEEMNVIILSIFAGLLFATFILIIVFNCIR